MVFLFRQDFERNFVGYASNWANTHPSDQKGTDRRHMMMKERTGQELAGIPPANAHFCKYPICPTGHKS